MNVPIGTIYSFSGSYWKVTGPKRSGLGCLSYPVIKCTKTGKEFKETNGMRDWFIEQLHSDGLTWKFSEVTEKVSTAGEASGIRKRRIMFLEDKIAAYTKELEELNKQEFC